MFSKFRLICSFALVAVAVSSAVTVDVNISGLVKDKSEKPVIGAKLKLQSKNDLSVITDAEGKFTLTGQFTAVGKQFVSMLTPSAFLQGFNIQVILKKAVPVEISFYNVAGRKVHDYKSGILNKGYNLISLPINRFGAGVYMVSVKCENDKFVFKYLLSSQKVVTTVKSGAQQEVKKGSSMRTLLNLMSAVDTLIVSAEGYDTAYCLVDSYTQKDMVIAMNSKIKSRLDYITKDCSAGEVPGAISGQSGWGSRYWDCCKPHCSWPEKTKTYSANCSVDGKTQIECFKDAGGWLQGTKSGCEDGGEAYMCYCHVPFAVCKNLAYGFAAVPSGNDACGKCFQLNFDGGFKHGEPKEAHRLMKGKTMIVMASNIGHDVGGGQFDIMIPGGGFGAFRNGCAKQWKVDVNNENLVGKNSGGFISKCQEKLGWDAGAQDLKDCVRDMCDNLFGRDPSLHDLWEGCIWYVEWMHAVDNPTFTYKEVTCPQALVDLYYSDFHPKP